MNQAGQHGLLLAGFAAGTFLTGLALSAMKTSPVTIFVPPGDIPTLVAGFGGAVLGAVIGAAVQYITSSQQRDDVRTDRLNEERERDLAAAFSCFIKASKISNETAGVQLAITEAIQEANTLGGEKLPLWVKVKPLIGLPPTAVQFSIEDLAFLFKLRLSECANTAEFLNTRYRVLVEALLQYNALRAAIASELTPNDDGDFDPESLSPEERRRLLPKFYDLQMMVEANLERIGPLSDDARSLVHELWPKFRERFGATNFPKAM